MAALQQVVRNAVMHRRYEHTNSPTRITWYEDRVEIVSPGGPFGIVANSPFGSGLTDYRNPTLAEIMRGLGYVQRFGAGIPIAKKSLALTAADGAIGGHLHAARDAYGHFGNLAATILRRAGIEA